MTPNIPLIRFPRPEDFEDVMGLAQKECHCADDVSFGPAGLCQTCMARQLLNDLTVLADSINR